MGQVLHGSATTTEVAIRRAIQNSEESLRALSKRYGINQKTGDAKKSIEQLLPAFQWDFATGLNGLSSRRTDWQR
ncbi:integrase, catalytic region [Rhizobium sp. Pop5]|nr:integrase, catalytic region [Rhizobium sp. Pop5]